MPWDNLHLWPLVSFQGEILKEFLIHKQTNKSQRQKKGRQQYYPGYRNEVDDHNRKETGCHANYDLFHSIYCNLLNGWICLYYSTHAKPVTLGIVIGVSMRIYLEDVAQICLSMHKMLIHLY